MKCFYHSADLDGKCSGAIVKARFPDCEMIGFDHYDRFPWESIGHQERVVMVDCSLPLSQMKTLAELCDLCWIDHHKESIEQAQADQFNPDGVRVVGLAACELTWAYMFHKMPMPRAVRLLGRWDVWDHADPECEPFQFGMLLYDPPPGDMLWADLFRNHKPDVDEIIEAGRITMRYQEQRHAEMARLCAFETTFEGLRTIAMNVPRCGAKGFATVFHPARHELMVSFYHKKDGRMSVSLYTESSAVDCAALAKHYGGNGHPRAAGFSCTGIPFEAPNPVECAVSRPI